MTTKAIKRLEEKVIFCLQKYPEARNNDTRLTLYIIHEYLPGMLVRSTTIRPGDKEEWWVKTEALYIVREDNVKRVRAKIQNDRHLYLPTDPAVRKQRKINEEVWHAYCATQ